MTGGISSYNGTNGPYRAPSAGGTGSASGTGSAGGVGSGGSAGSFGSTATGSATGSFGGDWYYLNDPRDEYASDVGFFGIYKEGVFNAFNPETGDYDALEDTNLDDGVVYRPNEGNNGKAPFTNRGYYDWREELFSSLDE